MLLTVFISSAILLFFMMLGLGLKWIFHTKSGLQVHTCGMEEGQQENNETCTSCGLNMLIDCTKEKVNPIGDKKTKRDPLALIGFIR